MNTESEPKKDSSLFEFKTNSSNDVIANLERQVEREKDRRSEERFIWVSVLVILFDSFQFSKFDNFGSPISLLILELLFLVVFGRMCGIDDIYTITEKLLTAASSVRGSRAASSPSKPATQDEQEPPLP